MIHLVVMFYVISFKRGFLGRYFMLIITFLPPYGSLVFKMLTGSKWWICWGTWPGKHLLHFFYLILVEHQTIVLLDLIL